MRTITKESINAFLNAQKFNRQNMEVEVLPNVTILKLHNNEVKMYKLVIPECYSNKQIFSRLKKHFLIV